jgi:hypothetical protein
MLQGMRVPGALLFFCAIAAAVSTLDFEAIRRLTEGAPRPNTFSIDAPTGLTMSLACDGPVTGTWVITAVSNESPQLVSPRCPGRVPAPTASGTITFATDGSFADTTVLTMNGTAYVPTSSRSPSCARLEAEIAAHGVRSVSCKDDVAGACACAETFDPPSSRWRWVGRYRVDSSSQGGEYQCIDRRRMRRRTTVDGRTFTLTATKLES